MHKHAKIIMEWAQMMQLPESEWRDVEFRYGDTWMSVDKGDAPAFNAHKEYRFKPRTIRIGDYDVPEPMPMRASPKIGSRYFSVEGLDEGVWNREWTDDYLDNLRLARGTIHETRENAELMLKALISLTQKKD